MGNKILHTVKLIGLSEHEQKVLNAIFLLSKTRPTSFGLFDEGKNNKPGMMIVNFDDKEAVHEWQTLCIQNTEFSSIPAIRVTRSRPRDTENYYTRRPFIVTRMLSLFERLAEKEFKSFDDGVFNDDELLDSSAPSEKQKVVDDTGKGEDKSLNSVLVVDDSLPVRIQMNMALKGYANNIDLAETGEKALELIKENSYDMIFLDVILPGVDGYDICKTIKNDEATKSIPVVMLTGNSSAEDQIKGTLAGCDSYLIKPVKSELFKETMARYI